jgi:hypothetical protein
MCFSSARTYSEVLYLQLRFQLINIPLFSSLTNKPQIGIQSCDSDKHSSLLIKRVKLNSLKFYKSCLGLNLQTFGLSLVWEDLETSHSVFALFLHLSVSIHLDFYNPLSISFLPLSLSLSLSLVLCVCECVFFSSCLSICYISQPAFISLIFACGYRFLSLSLSLSLSFSPGLFLFVSL